MQVVSYRSNRGVRAGVLRDDRVLDAWDLLDTGVGHPSVRELLARGVLDRLESEQHGEGVPLAEVELDVPIPDPEKIVCIGLNYRAHAAEFGLTCPRPQRSLRSSATRSSRRARR